MTTPRPVSITLEHLDVTFGRTQAIDDLTLEIRPGCITGLLGRNGAGKSTLMAVLAGYQRPSSGRVLVDGADPFDDPVVMTDTVLVRERVPGADSTSVKSFFELASTFRPNWDQEFALSLLDQFEIDSSKRLGKMSHGQRAAATVIAGLAARAPLTMFDEPHLGMDAPSRYRFYERLLADYAEHPRTIVLSTHIIEEAANIFDDALILDRGRLVTHQAVDDLRNRGLELTGPAEQVEALTAGHRVLSTRRLGPTASTVVFDATIDDELAARIGVTVTPSPLQDLFVALTDSPREETVR